MNGDYIVEQQPLTIFFSDQTLELFIFRDLFLTEAVSTICLND